MNNIDMSYSEAIEELEDILTALKDGSLGMDDMCESVKRASELIKYCKDKIYKTAEEVQKCLRELNENTEDEDNE